MWQLLHNIFKSSHYAVCLKLTQCCMSIVSVILGKICSIICLSPFVLLNNAPYTMLLHTVSSPHMTPLTFVGPMGFPGGPMVKKRPASAGHTGNMGLIPGSRRSPGGRNSNSFQYSCLGNPTGRGAWRTTIHRVAE